MAWSCRNLNVTFQQENRIMRKLVMRFSSETTKLCIPDTKKRPIIDTYYGIQVEDSY